MRSTRVTILALITLCSLLSTPSAASDKEKEQLKLAIDELKNEVMLLERQVRTMQESMDRNSGQMSALINQISDSVAAIRLAQSRVAESATSAITQVNGISEQLAATNQRIEKLSGQLAELKKLVEDMPKLPTFTQITPGNPDQLFAAAIGDYYRGNYDLAMSEFQQYVETYPSSEMADNAQYWIGECYYAKGKYNEAIAAFDKVMLLFPKGDKVPAARFKKAKALQQLGRNDAAQAEFRAIIKLYPRSNEAALALQELGSQ
jgi:tol-pal system protein YbgF